MLTFRLTFNGSVNRPFPGPFLGEEPTQTSYTVTTFNSSLRFTTCSIAYLYNGHAVHSPAISELVDYLFWLARTESCAIRIRMRFARMFNGMHIWAMGWHGIWWDGRLRKTSHWLDWKAGFLHVSVLAQRSYQAPVYHWAMTQSSFNAKGGDVLTPRWIFSHFLS